MICPSCGGEFRDGFTRCASCDVALVDPLGATGPTPDTAGVGARPDATFDPHLELVTVLRTGDRGLIALAKSLLESEGIPCVAPGEAVQDLYGLGRLGGGYNVIFGPVEVRVRAADADAAIALLADVESAGFVFSEDEAGLFDGGGEGESGAEDGFGLADGAMEADAPED